MKKNDLLKVLGITFLVFVLLSFVLPAGSYSSGTFTSLTTIPVGLYDLIRTPLITIATFIQYGLLFLAIGGFYGVLNETSAYSKLIEKITKKFKHKRVWFLIISVLVFTILASLFGSLNVLFILVPFMTTILLKLGYSKITSLVSTVGSMLIGQLGSILNADIWGYLMLAFGVKLNSLLIARIIIFVVIVTLLILIVIKKSKNEKIKNDDILLYEENKSKKSYIPIIIMGLITFVLLVMGCYNWNSTYEIELFENIHTSIMDFKIANYPVVSNIIGTISSIGNFNNYDIITILVFSSLIIGWIYSVKFSDILSSFAEGTKKMVKPAIYSMLSCVIFASLLNMTSGNFVNTMVNKFISGTENFNLLSTLGSGLVIGFAYNDFYYVLSNFYTVFGVYDLNTLPIVSLVFQTMYGFVMLIAPTSLFLLAGLSYLEIPYKEWVKYIWKYLLIIFGIIVLMLFILTI